MARHQIKPLLSIVQITTNYHPVRSSVKTEIDIMSFGQPTLLGGLQGNEIGLGSHEKQSSDASGHSILPSAFGHKILSNVGLTRHKSSELYL